MADRVEYSYLAAMHVLWKYVSKNEGGRAMRCDDADVDDDEQKTL